jgi:hypothetical protein
VAPLAGTRNGTAPPAAPASKPTLQQQHAQALEGMNRPQDRDNLDAWARWAKGFAFDERQCDQLEDAYRHSLERVAVAE